MNGLVRTQVLLEEQQRVELGLLSAVYNQSMGQLVRYAVGSYLKKNATGMEERKALIKKLAGCLANSPNWKNIDAAKWQRSLRREKGM